MVGATHGILGLILCPMMGMLGGNDRAFFVQGVDTLPSKDDYCQQAYPSPVSEPSPVHKTNRAPRLSLLQAELSRDGPWRIHVVVSRLHCRDDVYVHRVLRLQPVLSIRLWPQDQESVQEDHAKGVLSLLHQHNLRLPDRGALSGAPRTDGRLLRQVFFGTARSQRFVALTTRPLKAAR